MKIATLGVRDTISAKPVNNITPIKGSLVSQVPFRAEAISLLCDGTFDADWITILEFAWKKDSSKKLKNAVAHTHSNGCLS